MCIPPRESVHAEEQKNEPFVKDPHVGALNYLDLEHSTVTPIENVIGHHLFNVFN